MNEPPKTLTQAVDDLRLIRQVLEGMEVAEDIVNTRRDYNDRPMTPQVMKSVRVETYGVDYPFEQM